MLKNALAAAALLSTSVATHAGPMVAVPGDPVLTIGGPVAGTTLASGVRAYFGIPFAKPPVNARRWARPEPVQWDGVWTATRKGPQCVQVLRRQDINHYFGEEPSGEDCLYLNIWAPAGANAGAKLPVVVFIYGGAHTIGSSGMAHYDGEALAKRGAVFVNFNYRLGILGFMAHPELSAEQGGASGNYGYMDQSAALRWVRDNIASFGGDPAKIAIVGQSAGASSVAAQIMSPRSKGLFSAAMMSSGCNWTRELLPLAVGEKVGLDVQAGLGVKSLAEMRDMPADRILAQQAETQNMTRNAGVTLPRIVDGHFLVATQAESLARGLASAVPIIANSNGGDFDLDRYPLTRTRTVAEYRDLATRMYGADATAFLKHYPTRADANVVETARRAARDAGYIGGSRHCAVLQGKYNGRPVYVSRFDRRHSYRPGVVIADQDTATVGAYHNAEIPFFLGTLDAFDKIRSTRAWTADDRVLSRRMMDSLIAFARSGNPMTPELVWPAWTPARPDYIVLGGKVGLEQMDAGAMDWLAAHPFKPIAAPAPTGLRARD